MLAGEIGNLLRPTCEPVGLGQRVATMGLSKADQVQFR